MKMCRGLRNRAQQTQMSKLTKQDSTASKGVNYCSKCERRKIRKQLRKPKHGGSYEPAPISLIFSWLLFLFVQFMEQEDFVLLWVRRLAFPLLVMGIFADFLYYFRVIWRRLWRPKLKPQFGISRMDPYLRDCILLGAMFESMRNAKSKSGVTAAIVSYLQAHT